MTISKNALTTSVCALTLAFSFSSVQADSVRPGTVLYKIKDNASSEQLKSLNSLLKRQFFLKERFLSRLNLHVAKFNWKGQELAMSKLMMATGAVEFAEPDYEIPLVQTPDDQLYSNQWHHQTIHSPQAWDISTGDRSVLVAVCDTGVDSNHPDLAGNLVLPGYNAIDGSTYIEDVHGHGSGTAGTLAAVGNNSTGVAGVSWDVGILPVKVNISDSNSSAYLSTMAECIRWSADQGAKVVNLSYGGIQYSTIDDAAQYLRSKGGLLFMSAGNDGNLQSSYPDFTSFIAVGATDQNNQKASFSSYGDYIDIVAPGVSIGTTYKEGGYVNYSGTSFSSPMVAGVAALMHAVQPGISPDELEEALLNSATDLGDELQFGHGLVNAEAALNALVVVDDNIAPTALFSSSAQTGSLPFDATFDASSSFDQDGEVVDYAWSFGDGQSANGQQVAHTFTQSGSFTVRLTVTDNEGKTATTSEVIEVVNELPVAKLSVSTTSGIAPLEIAFDASGSYDTDGTLTAYEWSFGDGSSAQGVSAIHRYQQSGVFRATLTVTDNGGAVATDSVQIVVEEAPVIDDPEPTPAPEPLVAPSRLNASISGSQVTLSWRDNNSVEQGFYIERALKQGGFFRSSTGPYERVGSVTENVTRFVDLLPSSGTYVYRVQAYRQGEVSDFSKTDSIRKR